MPHHKLYMMWPAKYNRDVYAVSVPYSQAFFNV